MKKINFKGSILLLLLLLLISPGQQIFASQIDKSDDLQLETIEVTSQKTKIDKQKIASNVTVFDGYTIEELGIESIDELSYFTPNLSFNTGDNHSVEFAFRGIGGVTNMNKIWNINLDGVAVPYVNIQNILDVERIEILRGSQGALYGRNTHAGVINIVTRNPEPVNATKINFQYESYDSTKLNFSTGGPVGENNSYQLALSYSKEDTPFENKFLDREDSNDQEQIAGRIKFLNESDALGKLAYSLTMDRYDGGFDTYTLEDYTRKTTNNETGYNDGHLFSQALTWEKNINSYNLTSITSHSRSNYGFLQDWDFTSYDIMKSDFDENFDVFTQEIRVEKDNGNGLKWMLGGFFLREDTDSRTKVSFGKDMQGMPAGSFMEQHSTIDTIGTALFGKIDYRFLTNLEFTGCLRLDYQQRELNWSGGSNFTHLTDDLNIDESWFAALPTASLSYIFDENKRMYASVSRGYKAGDFNNVQVSKSDVENHVDPEYTTTYELGYKALLADKRLELNIAAFYIDWTDMQVETEVTDSTTSVKKYIKENAAEAHSMGAELEARARLATGWDVFLGLGWIYEAEFDKFPNTKQGDLTGKKLPDAKDYKISAGTIYRHTNGLFASFDMSLNGESYFDEPNTAKQQTHNLYGGKIGYESESFSIYLYGKNLSDEDYYVTYFSGAKAVGDPRIIGVQTTFNF